MRIFQIVEYERGNPREEEGFEVHMICDEGSPLTKHADGVDEILHILDGWLH